MRISDWSSDVCSSDLHSFGYSNGGSFIPYNGNLFSCAVGVPAACLPSGVPRVFLFQPDGTLRDSNYGTDFRPVGSGNNKGGDGSTLHEHGTLQPDRMTVVEGKSGAVR